MKLISTISIALFALTSVCSAQTLVSYNFNSSLAASTIGANIASASTFSVSDGGFTSTTFTTDSPPDSPAVSDSGSWNALTPTKYFSFILTPEAGYSLNITGISFDYRQTASGALNYQISIGATTNAASGTFSRDTGWEFLSETVTLTGLTGPIEVRIYGYNGGTGSFSIDRVTLSGSASAVPEPSAAALLAGAATLGLTVLRRRNLRRLTV